MANKKVFTDESLATLVSETKTYADYAVSTGTAAKATADASGNTITSTYATKTELSNKHKEITQVAYDALSEAEKNNGTIYLITDATDNVLKREVTLEQYNNLSEAEKKNGMMYFITDVTDEFSAGQVAYDNSSSGLNAVDVQSAIDEKGTIDKLVEFTGTSANVATVPNLTQYKQIMLVLTHETYRILSTCYPMVEFIDTGHIHLVQQSTDRWGSARYINNTLIDLNRTSANTTSLIVYGIR